MCVRYAFAAAAVVIGLGQAEAATVNRVTMTLTANFICEGYGCDEDDPAPAFSAFYKIPTNQPVTGLLSIADPVLDDWSGEWLRAITFTSNIGTHDFGLFDGSAGEYYNFELAHWWTAFLIKWDGVSGSLWYRDDDAPWSREVLGTIELAPVPLPASVALLPLGIGALAMMRRRRRSV